MQGKAGWRRGPGKEDADDSWQRVKIDCEQGVGRPGSRGLSTAETRDVMLVALRSHFDGGPQHAGQAQARYMAWEEKAERQGVNAPLSEAAKPWKRFIDHVDGLRAMSSASGRVLGSVDNIDFSKALDRAQKRGRSRGR
jgi:hypothetical protein